MEKKSVVAITVTYNRADTLEKNIRGLLNQSYKGLEKIIIIDNNSDSYNIKKVNEIKLLDERIKVIYLKSNLGGAGGFNFGMEYVRDNYDPKWYWIMDDDAYPREDCLEKLMKHSEMENVGFVAPLIWGVTKEEFQLYHHKNISSNLIVDRKAFNNYDDVPDISKIDANAFVGPLISASVIKKLGVADKNLFIYGDDTEYTFRITREYSGYLIKDAIIEHEDVFNDKNMIDIKNWWKQYYKYRNRYLFIDKFSISNFKRNTSKMALTAYIIIIGVKQMTKKYDFNSKKIIIKTLKLAIKDGIKNRTGKTIDPAKFLKAIH